MSAAGSLSSWGSLHPLNLLQLVAPYMFVNRVVGDNTHEFGLYLGAVPLLLAVWRSPGDTSWAGWPLWLGPRSGFAALALPLVLGSLGFCTGCLAGCR